MPSLFRKKVAAAVAAVAAAADDASIWRQELTGRRFYDSAGIGRRIDGSEDGFHGEGLRMGVVLTSMYPRFFLGYVAANDAFGNADTTRGGTMKYNGYDPSFEDYYGSPDDDPRRRALLGVPLLTQIVSMDVEGFLRGDPVEVPDLYAVDNAYRGDLSLNGEFYLSIMPAKPSYRIGEFEQWPGDHAYDSLFSSPPPRTWDPACLFGPTDTVLTVRRDAPIVKTPYYKVYVNYYNQSVTIYTTVRTDEMYSVKDGDYSLWFNWDMNGPGVHISYEARKEYSFADYNDLLSRIMQSTVANQKQAPVMTPSQWTVFTLPNPYGTGVPYTDENGQMH